MSFDDSRSSGTLGGATGDEQAGGTGMPGPSPGQPIAMLTECGHCGQVHSYVCIDSTEHPIHLQAARTRARAEMLQHVEAMEARAEGRRR